MRKTIIDIQRMKTRGEKIPMVTAYDYTSGQIVDRAGIPIILVGDSLGNVVLGYDTTIPVTMDDMLHHAAAVVRGSQEALIVGDMPFLTYTTADEAMHNAGRFLQEARVQAVKLEGGRPVTETVRFLVDHGIPVMGHLGLTPQSVNQFGGNRVQGKRADPAVRMIEDAMALQDAGVFALVLELVPAQLAAEITRRLRVPTIGIGAGPLTDGQVLIWQDLLGLYTDHVPRHTRVYADLATTIKEALESYAQEVRDGGFPGPANTALMDEAELATALEQLDGHDAERFPADAGVRRD